MSSELWLPLAHHSLGIMYYIIELLQLYVKSKPTIEPVRHSPLNVGVIHHPKIIPYQLPTGFISRFTLTKTSIVTQDRVFNILIGRNTDERGWLFITAGEDNSAYAASDDIMVSALVDLDQTGKIVLRCAGTIEKPIWCIKLI